jgi:hypothetical protein
MGKAEKGSKLLAALGKTKKEQMAKLYPKAKPKAYPKIKSKGPYTRGKVMGKGDFEARRAVMGGVNQALRKSEKDAVKDIATVVGAGVTGYGIGKGWHKKAAEALTKPKRKETTSHKDKARKMAQEAVKKQKKKKEKHHSR